MLDLAFKNYPSAATLPMLAHLCLIQLYKLPPPTFGSQSMLDLGFSFKNCPSAFASPPMPDLALKAFPRPSVLNSFFEKLPLLRLF